MNAVLPRREPLSCPARALCWPRPDAAAPPPLEERRARAAGLASRGAASRAQGRCGRELKQFLGWLKKHAL